MDDPSDIEWERLLSARGLFVMNLLISFIFNSVDLIRLESFNSSLILKSIRKRWTGN